jgi:hypothetical protein
MTMSVTAATRARPLSAMAAPRARKGIVFDARWPNPTWRNGASATPTSPSSVRGSMP